MSDIRIYRLPEMPFEAVNFFRTIAAAEDALANAYQPYSKFRVGCGVLCADGGIFKGCNVEDAIHDATHAEEAALAAMVVTGRRDPILCVCLGALEGQPPAPVMSCGKCRQKLMEFSLLSGLELWLHLDQISGPAWTMESYRFAKLSDLLPYHFGPRDIGVDLAAYRR